jgi:hypothetical protein
MRQQRKRWIEKERVYTPKFSTLSSDACTLGIENEEPSAKQITGNVPQQWVRGDNDGKYWKGRRKEKESIQ